MLLQMKLQDIKNIVIHKDLKKYDSLVFLDQKNNQLNLKDFTRKIDLIKFLGYLVCSL